MKLGAGKNRPLDGCLPQDGRDFPEIVIAIHRHIDDENSALEHVVGRHGGIAAKQLAQWVAQEGVNQHR
jgi:hypothetical protein